MTRITILGNVKVLPAPVKIDKRGPLFSYEQVMAAAMDHINSDCYFQRKAKNMTTDAEAAIEKTNRVTDDFTATLNKFLAVEKEFANESKRAAGTVREAAERLASGLGKVEKAANFDRLQRYVELLERAAVAMTTLAELEKTGKLDKIASAIR